MNTGKEINSVEMMTDDSIQEVEEISEETFDEEEVSKVIKSLTPGAGKRTIGKRKAKLLQTLSKRMQELNKRGVNSDYILAKFTDWKGPIRTTTKKLSNVINQLINFETMSKKKK